MVTPETFQGAGMKQVLALTRSTSLASKGLPKRERMIRVLRSQYNGTRVDKSSIQGSRIKSSQTGPASRPSRALSPAPDTVASYNRLVLHPGSNHLKLDLTHDPLELCHQPLIQIKSSQTGPASRPSRALPPAPDTVASYNRLVLYLGSNHLKLDLPHDPLELCHQPLIQIKSSQTGPASRPSRALPPAPDTVASYNRLVLYLGSNHLKLDLPHDPLELCHQPLIQIKSSQTGPASRPSRALPPAPDTVASYNRLVLHPGSNHLKLDLPHDPLELCHQPLIQLPAITDSCYT
ncbi:hypothetical protein RRG08_034133 [Elysia crispata]|uniref:Uncharacterized protein n=1 Tax=Elysia crispata TaxID=231223 RepID=A0AAE0ZMB1_9GAST|nr:hypothetical protein RRG08_034133 [Elysia crispata]